MKQEKKITIDGHMKGSDGSHNREKWDVNTEGMKKICHEEYDRRMVELEEILSMMMKQL